jgi:hypothetical protein
MLAMVPPCNIFNLFCLLSAAIANNVANTRIFLTVCSFWISSSKCTFPGLAAVTRSLGMFRCRTASDLISLSYLPHRVTAAPTRILLETIPKPILEVNWTLFLRVGSLGAVPIGRILKLAFLGIEGIDVCGKKIYRRSTQEALVAKSGLAPFRTISLPQPHPRILSLNSSYRATIDNLRPRMPSGRFFSFCQT